MNVAELFENDLGDLQGILLLMKHGKLTREKAQEVAKQLREFTFLVGGRMQNARLRWVEDKKTGTLKFISADMPGAWRSGPAAVSRGKLNGFLITNGFKVARFAHQAAKREPFINNGPHIYFWGPGTPEPEQKP